MLRVGVVGAGVIGLTSAIEIARAFPEADITVLADKFSPLTLSDLSAGFWMPYKAQPPEKILKWASSTQEKLDELIARGWPASLCTATIVSNKEEPLDLFFKPIMKNYRVEKGGAGRAKHAVSFESALIICPKFMARLIELAKSFGVKFVEQRVTSLEAISISMKLDVVVNCAGLRATELVEDAEVYPLRGVLVMLRPQSHLLNRVFDDDDGDELGTYVISRPDYCLLGGTAIKGDTSREASDEEVEGIIARCCALVPELGGPDIVRGEDPNQWKSCKTLLIHNYGHGGSGWTLSFGCAKDLVGILLDHFRKNPAKL